MLPRLGRRHPPLPAVHGAAGKTLAFHRLRGDVETDAGQLGRYSVGQFDIAFDDLALESFQRLPTCSLIIRRIDHERHIHRLAERQLFRRPVVGHAPRRELRFQSARRRGLRNAGLLRRNAQFGLRRLRWRRRHIA